MLRYPMPEEREAVERFFDSLERGLAAKVIHGHELAIVDAEGARFVVLTSKATLGLPAVLLETCDAAGLALGSITPAGFQLDLQGAVLAARHTLRQTARVTEHAARLFLYGRNLLGESVTHCDDRLERGDACIVTNPRNEAMGLGTVVGKLKGVGEAVRPIHDLGTYLRDQDADDR